MNFYGYVIKLETDFTRFDPTNYDEDQQEAIEHFLLSHRNIVRSEIRGKIFYMSYGYEDVSDFEDESDMKLVQVYIISQHKNITKLVTEILLNFLQNHKPKCFEYTIVRSDKISSSLATRIHNNLPWDSYSYNL